eukprot:366182-Chlamydomonas_euryale.AAC.2
MQACGLHLSPESARELPRLELRRKRHRRGIGCGAALSLPARSRTTRQHPAPRPSELSADWIVNWSPSIGRSFEPLPNTGVDRWCCGPPTRPRPRVPSLPPGRSFPSNRFRCRCRRRSSAMRRSVPSSQQSDRSSTPGGTSTAVVKAVIASKTSGTLNLSGRDLVELPACVYDDEQLPAGADSKWWEVTELSKLDLSRNQLKALPDRLGALSTLTHLDVSHNALQGLFSSLPTLDGLKLLNLEANRLIGLPDAVASLPHLVVLQVGDNRLRHLPDRLGYEQKILATVLCQKNTLEELPKGQAIICMESAWSLHGVHRSAWDQHRVSWGRMGLHEVAWSRMGCHGAQTTSACGLHGTLKAEVAK